MFKNQIFIIDYNKCITKIRGGLLQKKPYSYSMVESSHFNCVNLYSNVKHCVNDFFHNLELLATNLI